MKTGFMAMRNYLVHPGARIVTPEIIRQRDGAIIRKSQVLVAGPAAVRDCILFSKLTRALFVNSLFAFATYVLLRVWHTDLRTPILVALLVGVVAVLFAVASYKCFFIFGACSLRSMTSTLCATENSFQLSSLDKSAEVSQPSALHRYWVMRFNLRDGAVQKEICVRARIRPTHQKYWSLVIYDEYGLPIPQYYYDESYCSETHAKVADDGAYDVNIRMTSSPSAEQARVGHAELDLSQCTQGYAIFRIVHPTHMEIFEDTGVPSVTIMAVNPSKTD